MPVKSTPKRRLWKLLRRHPGSEEWHHRSLKKVINEASAAYYWDGTSTMSDAEYDMNLRMLVHIEELFPELKTADSPTQRVMN